MKRVAFKMKLKTGCETEYRKRHDEIWPELSRVLSEVGISDYSIFQRTYSWERSHCEQLWDK